MTSQFCSIFCRYTYACNAEEGQQEGLLWVACWWSDEAHDPSDRTPGIERRVRRAEGDSSYQRLSVRLLHELEQGIAGSPLHWKGDSGGRKEDKRVR